MGPDSLRVLRRREFRLVFTAAAVSHLGDRFVPVALAFAVLGIGGSATDLGFVLGANTIAMVACVGVAGVWADRLSRQHVMLGSDLVRAGVQATTAGLLLAHSARIWELVVLQAVYGASAAFFGPASTGLVPRIVEGDDLRQANALLGLSRTLAQVAGPSLAGVLVATVGSGVAIGADAASFVISAACLLGVAVLPPTPRARTPFVRELADGWNDFRSRAWLWLTVALMGAYNLLGMAPWYVLGPAIAKESLGGATAWGLIGSSSGLGALAGGMIALRTRPRRPLACGFLALLFWPPVLLALATGAPAAVVAAAVFGGQAAITFFGTQWFTALQEHVPDASLSRVSSFDWLGSFAFVAIGTMLVGPAAAAVGTDTALTAGACGVVATIAIAVATPSIRHLGRVSEAPDAVPAVV